MEQFPSREQNTQPEVKEGFEAKVTIHKDTVDIEAKSIFPGDIHLANQKREKQQLFDEMTSNLPGMNHCKISNVNPSRGQYTMERAQGIDLSGRDTPENIERFLRRPFSEKMKAFKTYIDAVAVLNENGWSFNDHKPDSIFYNRGEITVVDTGGMQNIRGQYQIEPKMTDEFGIGMNSKTTQNVLYSFFTKGLHERNKDFEDLIPQTVKILIDKCMKNEIKNMKELSTILDKYMKGENVLDIKLIPNPEEWAKQRAHNYGTELPPGTLNVIENDPVSKTNIGQDQIRVLIGKKSLRQRKRF